jgi:hypothetical protein
MERDLGRGAKHCAGLSGRSSRRGNRFELHANTVEPAPSRDATPTMVIHVQIEFFRKTIGVAHKQEPTCGRDISNDANGVGTTVTQNDLPDL